MADKTARWTVVAQREDVQPSSSGAITTGVTITFRTPSGVEGTVFVPHARYNVQAVKQAIDERAVTMEAVQALTGD